MSFKVLSLIALLSVTLGTYGQKKPEINIVEQPGLDCGFLENPSLVELKRSLISRIYNNFNSQSGIRSSTKKYKVPVVVHVIEPDKSSSLLSDEAIWEGITNLNNAFNGKEVFEGSPDTGIEFELARFDPDCNQTTGITRFDASGIGSYVKDGLPYGYYAPEVESWIVWDKKSYLNIWIVSRIKGGQVGGFASPELGAVIDNSSFFYGATTPHEVGHFLGLAHTFPEYGTDCKCGDGDGLKDTPDLTSYGLESICKFEAGCEPTDLEKIKPCTGKPLGLIQKNIMNYANCKSLFTSDQMNLMHGMLDSYHSPLLTSNALKSNPKPGADFSGDSVVYLNRANSTFNYSGIQARCSCGGSISNLSVNGNQLEVENLSYPIPPKVPFGSHALWTYELSCNNGAKAKKTVTFYRVGVRNIQSRCASPETYIVTFDNPQNYSVSASVGVISGNSVINIHKSTDLTLTVTAPDGTSDSVAIAIPCCLNNGIATLKCMPTSETSENGDYGIDSFSFGNSILRSSSNSIEDGSYYVDISCLEQATVNSGESYPISIKGHSTYKHFVKIYIDYNGDGDFEDLHETVLTGTTTGGVENVFIGRIAIPVVAMTEKKLRLRVIANAAPIQNPCMLIGSVDNVSAIGQIEDYSIFVNAPIIVGDLRLDPREIKATKLNWNSPWKSGLLGFEIQRSADKSLFETLAIIDFTQSNTTTYEYLDKTDNSKQYYYRIRQIMQDGSSETVQSFVTEKQTFSELPFVFPNPIKENHFILTLPDDKPYVITLFTESGTYTPIDIQETGIDNQILIKGKFRLSPGLYLLKVSNKITTYEKVVKVVIM